MDAERRRQAEERKREKNWKRWGPYLSERQWGTVREDYSGHQESWEYFTHDQARSRAYRWGEDGLLGWTDREGRLAFAVALWNGQDPILKERLFGLTGKEGNHGEDVKECYHYLESTPTHSYTKALYRYPQDEFPYKDLAAVNGVRGLGEPEYELEDTGVFEKNRYFDVVTEVAKRSPDDMVWRITAHNRSDRDAPLHLLPTVWYRNVWSWGCTHEGCGVRPRLALKDGYVLGKHESLGAFRFYASAEGGAEEGEWLFTENETNQERVFGSESAVPYVKDAFHRHLIDGEEGVVNPGQTGTKAAGHFSFTVPAGGSVTVVCRLHSEAEDNGIDGLEEVEKVFAERLAECEDFYREVVPANLGEEEKRVCRQGYAGLLWTKQFYHYVVEDWMLGDSGEPAPPKERLNGRNHDWPHFFARDVLSMPDKWEYPWFAAWDTAFHMIPFAAIDPDYAKKQLLLLLREWYMHPNGQLPAYEWNFSDVNPPVHAWAVWRVYKIADKRGHRDIDFLERAFQKLLLNFTWWVNRKDAEGRHVFGGGFLGLDNIGVFDRSRPLPGGGRLHQADGTAWMASYCLMMLSMALELALKKPAYEDIASKFFEHFVSIADAINALGGTGLWDEEDGFYYDQLIIDHEDPIPLKIRSLVGLLPLCAVTVLEQETIDALPGFKKRMDWFLENREELAKYVSYCDKTHGHGHRLLAIPSRERLERCLTRMLNEEGFFSPFGVRSLSKKHAEEPFVLQHDGERHEVRYVPGESDSWMFGGNSNWRGPVWFPVNYLIVEALERYHYFYGDGLKVECPTGSGNEMTLSEVAGDLCGRLISIFLPGADGRRPYVGSHGRYAQDAGWKDELLFYEYFNGDTGEGLGASHQTGWTALVVRLVRERAKKS